MSGGGGFFGTVLNIVSFAVPVLRPVAIAYNLASSVVNENPLGMLTSAAGAYDAFGGGVDFGGAPAGEWAGSLDPLGDASGFGLDMMGAPASDVALDNWSGTPFEGASEAGFLGSEGLQNAVNSDSNAWTNMVGDTVKGFDQSLAVPGIASNLSTGLESLGQTPITSPSASLDSFGIPGQSSSFATGTTENVFSPSTDNTGMLGLEDVSTEAPSTLEGMNSRWGSTDSFGEVTPKSAGLNKTFPLTGAQEPLYTYENKDFLTGKTGTGLSTPGNINPLNGQQFTQGLEMNNLPDIFKRLTTPIGNGGGVQAMSPLTMGLKGFGALDSLFQGKKAQDFMERQFNAANNWTDPNRARGDEANRLWQQNFNDPRAGYNEFMTGAGREFTDQARAQAAKSGRRGAYLNSGKMQSDLASLFMKNQLQRGQALAGGFAGGQNNYAATASAAPGYASMIRNQNAPIFDVLGEVSKNRSLMDLFGGGE